MYLTKTTRRMKVDSASHATASFEAMIRLPLLVSPDFCLQEPERETSCEHLT